MLRKKGKGAERRTILEKVEREKALLPRLTSGETEFESENCFQSDLLLPKTGQSVGETVPVQV